MENKKPTIIIFKESFLASILSDTYTFGGLAAFFWFNYHYIGGSYFVNGLILFMFMLSAFTKAGNIKQTFYDKESAIKFLKEKPHD